MLQFSDNEIRRTIDLLCKELNRKGIRQEIYLIIVGAASIQNELEWIFKEVCR